MDSMRSAFPSELPRHPTPSNLPPSSANASQSVSIGAIGRSNSGTRPLLGTSPQHSSSGSAFGNANISGSRSPAGNLPESYWEDSRTVNLKHTLNGSDQQRRDGDSRTQLFIGNLPFRVRWQDLKDLFRKCGTVLRADVALTLDNRSKGFGTVLYASEGDAYKAIEMYNGYNWQSRVLDVRLDQQDPTGSIAIAMASNPQSMQSIQSMPQMQPGWGNGPASFPIMPMNTQGGQNQSPGLAYAQAPGLSASPNNLGAKMGSGISRPSSSASIGNSRRGSNTNIHQLHSTPSSSMNNMSRDDMPHESSVSTGSASTATGATMHTPPQPFAMYPPGYAAQGSGHFVPVIAMPQGAGPPLYALQPYPYLTNGGLMGFYQSHQHGSHSNRSTPPPLPPAAYANRHLFVGNLPFNCQWQDLKDLFRTAGNILRADVTIGPEGRSRGFGTVLYATPEDALRAVEMFNGFEYNGRLLKVHFDKYAAHISNMQGNGPPSQHGSPYMSPQQTNASSDSLPPFNMTNGRSGSPALNTALSDAERLEKQIARESQQTPERQGSRLGSASNSYEQHAFSRAPPGQGRQAPGHLHFSPHQFSTGPAALMSPQPGGPNHQLPDHFNNAMSPQSGRASMTPSMPGFSFHPFPQTPPLVPHFLSPGLGPFSPNLATSGFNQPVTGYNPAPGAPVHDAGNQAEYNPPTGYFPSLDGLMSNPQDAATIAAESAAGSSTEDGTARASPAPATQSPAISTPDETQADDSGLKPAMGSLLSRRASTNSGKVGAALGVGAAPGSDRFQAGIRSASHSADKPRAEFLGQQQRATSSGLEDSLASLSLLSQGISAFDEDRPKSLNNSAVPSPVGLGYPSQVAPGSNLAPDNSGNRRASFEPGSMQQSKMAFGKSIWS